MQATTSGVTPKREVILQKDLPNLFLIEQKKQFLNFCEKQNVIFQNKVMVSDVALNYLNVIPESKIQQSLKNMVLNEYYSCEHLYPYLGDFLLFKMFAPSRLRIGKEFVFERRHQDAFIKSINNKVTNSVASWFFNNCSLNRSIRVEEYLGEQISVESLEEFDFKIEYDYDFYKNIRTKEVKNYRFVLINGMIESVGEIHHLLTKANQNKEPYVIFCFGVSEEVKQTIIKNNAMGRLRVYPVCFNSSDENSLNILNDLAVIHNDSIVSSDLGQTISQEVRKNLPVGEKITLKNGIISLVPVANKNQIESHRKFLRTRLNEAKIKSDVRDDVIENRLKMFTGKRVNFYIPKKILKSKGNARSLDYYFKFISKIEMKQRIVTLGSEKFYIPSDYIKIAESKKKSLVSKMHDIKAIIC